MKISSEGLGGNSAKFCTSKKFPTIRHLRVHAGFASSWCTHWSIYLSGSVFTNVVSWMVCGNKKFIRKQWKVYASSPIKAGIKVWEQICQISFPLPAQVHVRVHVHVHVHVHWTKSITLNKVASQFVLLHHSSCSYCSVALLASQLSYMYMPTNSYIHVRVAVRSKFCEYHYKGHDPHKGL